MQKSLILLASAALAAGSFAFLGNRAWADEPKPANESHQMDMSKGMTAELPAGIEKSQKDDSSSIRSLLAQSSDAAVRNNTGLDSLVSYFSTADRDRIEPHIKQYAQEAVLNGRLNQFHKDWKNKYGSDFVLNDQNDQVVFGPQFTGFTIVQGEVTNPALLSNWPVENKSSGQENMKNEKPEAGAKANIEKGWQVALITLPAANGLPEVNVSTVQEKDGSWRLDIPKTLDAKTLHDNILAQLTYFDEHPDRWPSDVNEAYRMASQRIFAAVYNVNAPEAAGQPMHMMNTPSKSEK